MGGVMKGISKSNTKKPKMAGMMVSVHKGENPLPLGAGPKGPRAPRGVDPEIKKQVLSRLFTRKSK